MNMKEQKQRSKLLKEIKELSKNDAPKLLQLCKDDECYETLEKKFRELAYYYNNSITNLLSAPPLPKTPDSDTSAAIKGQILGGTAGAIINYEKNKEARKKYGDTVNEHYKYINEYEKNWDLTVQKYNEILDILNSNKKFQLYFAQKKQKQEEEKRNRWETKEKNLFTISFVLSIIFSTIVSIILYNLNKNDVLIKGLSHGLNIAFSIIVFILGFFIFFILIANLSNDLFDKNKKR